MLVSTGLGSIPFASSTDVTRLQMSNKQMNQCLLYDGQKHPYVLGSDYRYLTHNSRSYICNAVDDGNVLFVNDEIMIVLYNNKDDFQIYNTPLYLKTKSSFCVKLEYRRNVGGFKKGDIIYHYNGFSKNNTPIYGYNLNTLYNPFVGYTYEDAVVVSQSTANKMKHRKIEKIVIPIYTDTYIKPNENGTFFPKIGEQLNKIVISEVTLTKKASNELINVYSINTLLNNLSNDSLFNTTHTYTKLNDPVVYDLKVHKFNTFDHINLIELKEELNDINKIYNSKITKIRNNLIDVLGKKNEKYIDYNIINRHYKIISPTNIINKVNNANISYIVEIDLLECNENLEPGDKITNRYGGKGVVSTIIPDELMPIDEYGNIVDCIISPLSVPGRTNYGQTLEGLIARVVHFIEKKIIKDDNWLILLKQLIEIIKDFNSQYHDDVIPFIDEMSENKLLYNKFRDNVIKYGLYVECPLFYNVDLSEISDKIYSQFGFKTNIDVKFSREFLDKINKDLNLSMPLPDKYNIINNALCVPIYTLKLHKIAKELIRARDVGNTNAYTNINTEVIYGRFKGCKLGYYMEIFALASYGANNILSEIRNAKSDNIKEKIKMHKDFILTGKYEQSEKMNDISSGIKKSIDSYIYAIVNS